MKRGEDAAQEQSTRDLLNPSDVAERATAEATHEEAAELDRQMESARQVGRSAAMMSVLVIISRITGFLRTWAQAFALGVTALASCYTVANNLPNMLYELVMGGMLMTSFLPVYLSVKKRLGREGSNRYASNLLSIVLVLMGLGTILCLIFAAPLVWTQSFGANEDFDSQTAVYFFRFFAIEVLLYACATIVSGILNAERNYFWSNLAPIFNNFVCTASFILYVLVVDTNPQLALLILAIGNPLGVAVQVLMQLPALHRCGVRFSFRIDLHDPALRETLSIGIPSLIVTVVSFPTVAVQTSCALSVTAAGASIAYYARLWYVLPFSIFAIPITTAMFTELSEYVADSDMGSFIRGVSSGTSQICFLLIPMALYLGVFGEELVTFLAVGSFDAQGIADTTLYLQMLAIALPFYGVSSYLQKICSALRRMRFFAIASTVASVVQIVFCFVFTPLFGIGAVAFSSALFYIAIDIVTFLNIRRTLGRVGGREILASCLRAIAVGVVGAAVGWALLQILIFVFGALAGSTIRAFAYVAVGGVAAVVTTYACAGALRMPEARFLRSILGRLRR